jgi:hypothetical protein
MAAESDEVLLGRARDDGRAVVTDDKDFGDLVVHRRLSTAGVLLLRLSAPSLASRIARLATDWAEIERGLPGRVVAVSDGKVRVRPLPAAGDEA